MSGFAIASGIGFDYAGFYPTNLDNCKLWLDATRINQADNTAVATWDDLSGNNYNATQATSANRPTFRTNQINGKPAVIFDGTNDTLSVPSSTSIFKFLHSTDSTVFIVARAGTTSDPAANMAFIHTSTGTTNTGMFFRYLDTLANNDRIQHGVHFSSSGNNVISNITANNTFTANVYHYLTLISKPTSSTASERSDIRIDNGSAIKLNAATNTASTANSTLNLTFGGYSSSFLNGALCEVIIYDRVLSAGEIQQMHNYLKSKWDL